METYFSISKKGIPDLTVKVSDDGSESYRLREGEFCKKPVFDFFKRAFDLLLSALLILVLLPVLIVIAIIVKIDSKGPAIYKQVRLGRGGVPFTMYKFRSMRPDAESGGEVWAEKDDPRVTRFGRFMRNSRIDELPQLFNILGGSMSFVGPRPERPSFYENFSTYIFGFEQRLFVKPGLTGHAQVNGGYDLPPEKKAVYDIFYIENRSAARDIACILKTIAVVLSHKGAR